MSIRIAVDTGGTFTDLVMLKSGELHVHKVRSTPDDPARAILTGIQELSPNEPIEEIIHGSTVATNALLERKGARIAFLTTAGFEDILRIGRQTRPKLYDFFVEEPPSLIEDGMTLGVAERIGPDGAIMEPLADAEIDRILAWLRQSQPESVAICLLHSYANPAHERLLEDAIQDAGFSVSRSSVIVPEYREFERAGTTAVNAYVSPVMSRYLSHLADALPSRRLRITQSSGGSISAETACREAVQTVLSGPAAGAVGALTLAQASGFSRVIAFDMGGTSTDVTLLDNALPMTIEAAPAGFPVRLPMLDIHTVGAGGGSLVYVDSGGALRVGPQSAGAQPGPACYGIGDQLTVTDANLLLGRLSPEFFLGGRMALDESRPRRIAQDLSARLGLTSQQLAEGIVRIANSNMERALRVVSVQRGYDPRDFALLAFGGAGGMHACDLAASMDISTVLVPRHAGILSALGMLFLDHTRQTVKTLLTTAGNTSHESLAAVFTELEDAAARSLAAEGFTRADLVWERVLDLRYAGQSYEISLPFRPSFPQAFHELHQRLYGYRNDRRAVEIVNARVKASGQAAKPTLPQAASPQPCDAVPAATHPAVFNGHALPTPHFPADALEPGMGGAGPALIASAQSTTIIPPGWSFRVDALHTLVLTRSAGNGSREAAR